MIDDVLGLSNCGPESTQLQEYINIKTASKKLQFATDKTARMHVGSKNNTYKCDQSYIDSWGTRQTNPTEKFMGSVKVRQTQKIKYLGEIISSDGTNSANVSARMKRGFGTIRIC